MKNCTKRKREFRIHEILSNGQHFNMYFKKHNSKIPHVIHGIWTVGLHIGESRKVANLWYDTKSKNKVNIQTGTCGLEGLKKAADYLVQFSHLLSYHSELQVGWQDDKRKNAYRWLIRHGFEGFDDCYSTRNPKYWIWKGGEQNENEAECIREEGQTV